nr:alpha-(1,3)-fucosyltransferase 5-like [Cavia porcellus]
MALWSATISSSGSAYGPASFSVPSHVGLQGGPSGGGLSSEGAGLKPGNLLEGQLWGLGVALSGPRSFPLARPATAPLPSSKGVLWRVPVDVYGRGHLPLPRQDMQERLARYKFYLAFENSQHPDYITEKLWNNALGAPAVPVVLGPSRANYERVLPPDAFIHVDDFPSPRALAQHLLALDQDDAQYLRHFRWRDTLQVGIGNWTLAFCKACWRLQEGPRYQTVASIAAWFK